MTYIGYDAFYLCSKLTHFYYYGITEPRYNGNQVLRDCTSLTTIYVPTTYTDDDETKFCYKSITIKKELQPI